MKIPFGKYKGVGLHEVPVDFLSWLAEQPWLFADLRDGVDEEIERRATPNRKRRQELEQQLRQDAISGKQEQEQETTHVVCGTPLASYEWELFLAAVRSGRLTIPLWLPVASRLPAVWKTWCMDTFHPYDVYEDCYEKDKDGGLIIVTKFVNL